VHYRRSVALSELHRRVVRLKKNNPIFPECSFFRATFDDIFEK